MIRDLSHDGLSCINILAHLRFSRKRRLERKKGGRKVEREREGREKEEREREREEREREREKREGILKPYPTLPVSPVHCPQSYVARVSLSAPISP